MPYTIATTTSGVNLTTSEISTQAGAFKTALSLGNVNNTSDATKPISTAQQAALDLKVSKAFVSELLYSPASLDYAFADDKAFTRNALLLNGFLLTARKGPSLTYTRATGATTFDADGLVKYSPENLLNFSESFATSGGTANNWADTNFTRAINLADPIGGFTAIRFTANAAAATVISSAAIGSSDLRTFSFWMRRVTGTGIIAYTIDGGATYTTIASTTLPTVWTRYSYTATADHRVGFKVNINADAIEIWGAQLERSLIARQYLSTTSSVVYGPRFWHDPRSLNSRGLLLEKASTNICYPSNAFAGWNFLSTSCSASNTTATLDPAGTNTADVIVETANTATHSFQLGMVGANIANATRYTFSCFVKPNGRTFCALSAFPGSTNGASGTAVFSLSGAGTVITGFTPSDATPTIVAFPNGWYRVSMSTTATTSGGGNGGAISITIGADSSCGSYLGDITKGLYVYGAQVEAGLRASTYIPTTGAPVLRAQADCRLEGNDFASIYNQSEGTVKLTVQPLDPTIITLGLLGIEVNSRPNGSMSIGTNGLGTFTVSMLKQSYANVATYTTSWSLSSPTSVAFAYKSNNCNAAFNSVSQTAITNTTLGSEPMVRMALGANGISSGPQSGSGLFSRLTIYKSRISNEYLKIATS